MQSIFHLGMAQNHDPERLDDRSIAWLQDYNWSHDKGVNDCQSLASMLINFHHTTQTPHQ